MSFFSFRSVSIKYELCSISFRFFLTCSVSLPSVSTKYLLCYNSFHFVQTRSVSFHSVSTKYVLCSVSFHSVSFPSIPFHSFHSNPPKYTLFYVSSCFFSLRSLLKNDQSVPCPLILFDFIQFLSLSLVSVKIEYLNYPRFV